MSTFNIRWFNAPSPKIVPGSYTTYVPHIVRISKAICCDNEKVDSTLTGSKCIQRRTAT